MLTVKLSSCGNPDYGQNPSKSVTPIKRNVTIEVFSLREASEQCKAYVAEWNLGSGNWNGGQVHEDNKQIAQISYNGRIWDMNDREII